jgi:regulatory protein YycH of two-component signal transduction system YycFG
MATTSRVRHVRLVLLIVVALILAYLVWLFRFNGGEVEHVVPGVDPY